MFALTVFAAYSLIVLCNSELYKKMEVPSNLWNTHVFKSLDHTKTKIECGSVCLNELACNGFKHVETCFLIDMNNAYNIISSQMGDEVYMSISKYNTLAHPIYKNQRKNDETVKLREV